CPPRISPSDRGYLGPLERLKGQGPLSSAVRFRGRTDSGRERRRACPGVYRVTWGGSACGRGAGRVAGAGGVEAQVVHRTGGGDEQVVAFGAAEGEVGGDLGEVQLAEQGAVGVEAVDPIVGGGPDPAGVVEPDAVEGSGVAGGEHLPGGQGTAAGDVEEPDV